MSWHRGEQPSVKSTTLVIHVSGDVIPCLSLLQHSIPISVPIALMDFILRIDTSVILWSQKNITTLANIYAHEDANLSVSWLVCAYRQITALWDYSATVVITEGVDRVVTNWFDIWMCAVAVNAMYLSKGHDVLALFGKGDTRITLNMEDRLAGNSIASS